MIRVLFSFMLMAQAHAAPNEISGEVALASGLKLKPGGVLFIIAKEGAQPTPTAVLRVPDPKFPYKFTLTEKNVMMAGAPFKGPFLITARYSPSGDAMDKSGPTGTESKPVTVGSTEVKIEIKAPPK